MEIDGDVADVPRFVGLFGYSFHGLYLQPHFPRPLYGVGHEGDVVVSIVIIPIVSQERGQPISLVLQ